MTERDNSTPPPSTHVVGSADVDQRALELVDALFEDMGSRGIALRNVGDFGPVSVGRRTQAKAAWQVIVRKALERENSNRGSAGVGMKDFPVEDVISVMSGMMVSKSGLKAFHDVLEHMLQRPVFTHELANLSRAAEPVLLMYWPTLAQAIEEANGFDKDHTDEWVAKWRGRYGDTRGVPIVLDLDRRAK